MNITTAGTYTLSARVAATAAGKTFHVELDGVNVSGTLTVPNTGGWQTWQTVTADIIIDDRVKRSCASLQIRRF